MIDAIFYWTGAALWIAGGIYLTSSVLLYFVLKSISDAETLLAIALTLATRGKK